MKKLFSILFLVALTTGITITVSAQKAADLKAEIEKINQLFVKATMEKEMGTVAKYYTNDFINMPNMMPIIRGKEEAIAQDKMMEESDIEFISFNLNTTEVIPTGKKYAYELGTYDMVMKIPGLAEPWIDKGKYLTVWVIEEKKELKMKVTIYNTDINPWEDMQKKGGY